MKLTSRLKGNLFKMQRTLSRVIFKGRPHGDSDAALEFYHEQYVL